MIHTVLSLSMFLLPIATLRVALAISTRKQKDDCLSEIVCWLP